jgi:hypothetical protein
MKIIDTSNSFRKELAAREKRRPGRPVKAANGLMIEMMEAAYAETGKYRHLTAEFVANGYLPKDIRAARKILERLWARSRKAKSRNTRISK